MSDQPTPDLPPPSQSSNLRYEPSAPATSDGCALIVGVIAGFILFVVCGAGVLSIGRSGAFGTVYLIISFGGAVTLAFRPGFGRGMAIGIFLGLGAVLMLIAICSGSHL